MATQPERTFLMIKPDGVQRAFVGTVIERFEKKGFKLVGLKFMWASEQLVEQHYIDRSSKDYFPDLVKFICSGPVVPMVWEGLNVVKAGRRMIEATNADSQAGTIRGDFSIFVGHNIIHGADSVEAANREIALWFGDNKELIGWTPAAENWVYE